MSPAVLAFSAGALGVFGAWDLLGAVERPRVAAWLRSALAVVRRATHEGAAPSAPERRRLAAVATLAALAGGWILSGPVAGALAATAGPGAALALVRARQRRYRAAVTTGAAAAARALAAELAAGRSVRVAFGGAADAVPGAAGRELLLAARRMELGEPTEPVLERLRRRAASAPWNTFVAAVLLQRDAGGDLSRLLSDLASALEDAARAERDALAATAQSRFTAGLVAVLPAAAAGLAELGSPGFVLGLLGDPLSATLVAAAAVLQIAALFAIRRLTRP